MMPTGRDGFTLMEALVALAVLAVAATGLVGATEAHVDQVRGLENRAIAQWIAQNRLAELGLGERGADQRGLEQGGLGGGTPASGSDEVAMLGRRWRVDVAVKPSQDPDLAMVSINVTPAQGRGGAARLSGFVDTRQVGRPVGGAA